MAKRTPGLTKRGAYWHINKVVRGTRIYESTGTGDLAEAERRLNRRLNEIMEQAIYGRQKERKFIEAATKYLNETEKESLERDAVTLKLVMPYIGSMRIGRIHMGTLDTFISDRQRSGIKNVTINRDLAVVRRVLMLAARLWRDDEGRPWLAQAPLIQQLRSDARKPYPISWEEQGRMLAELPRHLADMALFALNTGCRENEICALRWKEEVRPGVFMLSEDRTKNKEERLIVLNGTARNIINAMRETHADYVFTYRGHPVNRMNGRAWRLARSRAGVPQCRVHDLRHTFGRRLRAAGVSYEDRQDLLGHKSKRITTHYSKAEINNLLKAVESLVECRESVSLIRVIK